MIGYRVLIGLLFSAVVVSAEGIDENATYFEQPRDRFRLMAENIDEQRIKYEVRDLTDYSCEKMVIIRNRVEEQITLNCSSEDDGPKKEIVVQPGKAFIFTFKARKDGNTKFWCNVMYMHQYFRFDVYNEELSYMCPRSIDQLHQYTVHHDGIYADEARRNGGVKIGALFKGDNKFMLWEEFRNRTDGLLYSGWVDRGMCSDIPQQFNDKTKSVTICYNHCIHLYEHFGCRGKVQTLQAKDDCMDFEINEELDGKLSSVKGC